MQANLLTLLRILVVFVVIGLYQVNFYTQVMALCLTAITLYLDALDGLLARKLGIATKWGALFDITGDRIVENVLWVYFAATGMLSFWAAALVIARSFLVDWLRTIAFSRGDKTPFGEKSMMKSRWARALVNSRFSRGLYGTSKAIVFVYLGALMALESGRTKWGWSMATSTVGWLDDIGQIIGWVTVAMCMVRGIPVVWDSRDLLNDEMFPGLLRESRG